MSVRTMRPDRRPPRNVSKPTPFKRLAPGPHEITTPWRVEKTAMLRESNSPRQFTEEALWAFTPTTCTVSSQLNRAQLKKWRERRA